MKFAEQKNSKMSMLARVKSGWTALKFIRVGLGSLILYSSIESGQVPGIIVGGIFTLFSLLTDGVCCAGACYTPASTTDLSKTGDIEYEELGAK